MPAPSNPFQTSAAIFKRLSHADVRIFTLSEGEINELHIGLKGTMNALFLKDLAQKTQRGQRGRVEADKIPGGKSFGYKIVWRLLDDGSVTTGEREIDEGEAAVIKRIFNRYADGMAPRRIADQLNAEGLPGPLQPRPESSRRPKRLLSGLLKCACCGANYILQSRDHMACAANRNRGTCGNTRHARMGDIEGRVIAGLKRHLLAPDMLRAAMAKYATERARLAKAAARAEAGLRQRMGEVTRVLERMVDAIARMNALEREGLEARLAENAAPAAVRLHPRAAEAYVQRLEALQRACREGEASPAEMQTIRALITDIIVTSRDEPGKVDLEIRGDLAALMLEPDEAARRLTMVAGARYQRCLHLNFATL